MPQIPVFENQLSAQIGSPAPRIDPGVAGAPGAALAQAGGEVGGVAEQWARRYADARRQADAANLVAGASAKLGDAQFRWSKVADSQAAYAGYSQEAGQLRQSVLDGIDDPLVKAHVTDRLDQESIIRGLDTRNAAFQLESSARRGDLDTRLNQYAQSAATTSSDLLRAKITDDANADIAGSVAAGWLHPEEGAQHKLQFASRVQQVAAEQERNAALASRDPDAAFAWARKVNDPASYPGLLPQAREALGQRAESIAYRLSIQAASRQAHEDATADRELRRAQGGNAATLIAAADGGQDIAADDLAKLVRTQQLSESGFAAVLAAGRRAREGEDDRTVSIDLWKRINAPGAGDHGDEIADALAAGTLKGATAAEMMKANGARQRAGENAVERGYFGELKTALGGHAVEQGMLDFTKEGAAAQAALWAQAQGEWTKRVVVGNEAPGDVLAEMLPRYQRTPQVPAAWPAPRLGAVASTADVAAIWQKTRDAADAGQITPDQLQSEAELLNRYRGFYQAQEQRKAAVPAKPTSGGAKLRGAAPAGDSQ